MTADRIIASVALIVAVVALGVAAWAITDNDDRDACARLADLSASMDSSDTERALFFDAFTQGIDDVPANDALIRDCLNG